MPGWGLARRLRRRGVLLLGVLLAAIVVGAAAFLSLTFLPADSDSVGEAEGVLTSPQGLTLPAVPTVVMAPTPTPTPVVPPTPTPIPPTPVPPPAPPPLPSPGPWEHWIDVNLTTQTVTAMLDNQPYYTALATTGMPGWETPTGTFRILYRVENETMTSEALGIPPEVESYELKDVLFTQYFTNRGHAIHLNYWRPEHYFGSVASSHGCVGVRYADAEFFWNFASVGTRVVVHY